MPIHRFSRLSPTAFLLIWKIEESIEGLLAQLDPLLAQEVHTASIITAPERMRQSVAARLALEQLLKLLGIPLSPLAKQASGRPILTGSPNVHLSFSHTPYAAAVAISTAFPIGMDIEQIQPKLGRIQERVLTPQERKHTQGSLERLSVYWCAKEALYKCLGGPPNFTWQQGCLEAFELRLEGTVVMHWQGQTYEMHYQKLTDVLGIGPHMQVYVEDKHYTKVK
jgi:phosphopantetheinyl transferase